MVDAFQESVEGLGHTCDFGWQGWWNGDGFSDFAAGSGENVFGDNLHGFQRVAGDFPDNDPEENDDDESSDEKSRAGVDQDVLKVFSALCPDEYLRVLGRDEIGISLGVFENRMNENADGASAGAIRESEVEEDSLAKLSVFLGKVVILKGWRADAFAGFLIPNLNQGVGFLIRIFFEGFAPFVVDFGILDFDFDDDDRGGIFENSVELRIEGGTNGEVEQVSTDEEDAGSEEGSPENQAGTNGRAFHGCGSSTRKYPWPRFVLIRLGRP